MPGTAKAVVEEVLITKDQAAKKLGVTEGQVRRYIHAGRLAAEKRDGATYVKLADLVALKEAIAARVAPPPVLYRPLPPKPEQLPTSAEPEPIDKHYTPEPRRPPRALATIAETVHFFGVKRKWLLEHLRNGHIPAINFGHDGREDWRVVRDQFIYAVRAAIPR